jgi:hypothetical protein
MSFRVTASVFHFAVGSVLLAACHASAAPEAVPAAFSLSASRQPAETLSLSAEDQEAVYRTVLYFYRPATGHVRWLDRRLLPAAPSDPETALDRPLALRLVAELGPTRFCIQETPSTCNGRSGGVLRVSPVYELAPGQARVLVDFKGDAGPYAPGTAHSGLEVFLVEKHEREWRIRAHTPTSR